MPDEAENDYCEKTGLPFSDDRVHVFGYNRDVAGKATAATKARPVAVVAQEKLAKIHDGQQTNATKHLLERSSERGVSKEAINDAINSPLHVKPVKYDEKGRPSKQYIGKDATVSVNPDTGDVTSTWVTGSKTRKKYQKE